MVHHSARSIQKEHCDHERINYADNAEVHCGPKMVHIGVKESSMYRNTLTPTEVVFRKGSTLGKICSIAAVENPLQI